VDVTGEPAPGQGIADYRIDELVGRGGMAEVYRAFDTRLERTVALKLLGLRFASDERFCERMVQESRLAAGLDHPNVIPIYEAGQADGRWFIAMRFVDGTDLRALLRRDGVVPPARAIHLADQIADALDAAHARGLVHRDVKPSNVLIDDPGGRDHCYLADFGVSERLGQPQAVDGRLTGTIDYIAPEQIRGDQLDGRADQYALACLLFETLTGLAPYTGRSDVAVIFAHLEEPAPTASSVDASLPMELDAVLARAMAKEPDDRYPSCREFVADARAALGLEVEAAGVSRRMVMAGLAVVAALAVAVVVLLSEGGSAPAARAASVVRIDPGTNAVTQRLAVSAHPGSVAAGSDRVWVANAHDGTLWRINPATGDAVRMASVGTPRDVTIHAGRAFVASDGPQLFGGNVAAYNARGGGRLDGLDLNACSVTSGPGVGVWASGCPNVEHLRFTNDLKVDRQLMLPFAEPRTAGTLRACQCDMAVGFGAVWVVGDALDPRLWRIDPTPGRVTATIPLPFAPRSVATGEGGVWVTSPLDDVVARVDPETNRITATVDVGRGAAGVAVGAGAVWVANQLDGTVTRISPDDARVVDTIDVHGRPVDLAAGEGGVWVSVDER
jgi:streptogramin lyase